MNLIGGKTEGVGTSSRPLMGYLNIKLGYGSFCVNTKQPFRHQASIILLYSIFMIRRTLATIGFASMLMSPFASFAADSSLSSDSDASISSAKNSFLSMFLEGNGVSGGNRFSFDTREFHSHPCFSAVGSEQEYCLELFGIDTDFEEMIRTNSLNSMLIDYMLARRCDGLFNGELSKCQKENVTLLPQLRAQLNVQQQSTTGSVVDTTNNDEENEDNNDENEDDTTANTPRARYLRSQHVWALCENHTNTQAGCYQDYLRFVTDETRDMSELEKILGTSSNEDDNDQDADEDENEDNRNSSETSNKKNADDVNVRTSARSKTRVGSEQEEEPATREDRANWLWDLCADARNQPICYRQHFRTAQNSKTDLNHLEMKIRGM